MNAPTKPVSDAPKHFLDIADLDASTLNALLAEAMRRKVARKGRPHGTLDADAPLTGRVLALIFDKHSTRTRISFDVGMRQLGGTTIMMSGQELQLAREETIGDTARVLSRYVDAVMIRLLDHEMVRELAQSASIPIINGLTKLTHPCQVLADVMTFEEKKGPIKGRTIAWTGDASNVLTSWVHAAEDRNAARAGSARVLARMGDGCGRNRRIRRGRAACRGRGGLRDHRYMGLDG
jgi:ornithine carbamoyltransferase